jgi:hypothetical protein
MPIAERNLAITLPPHGLALIELKWRVPLQ